MACRRYPASKLNLLNDFDGVWIVYLYAHLILAVKIVLCKATLFCFCKPYHKIGQASIACRAPWMLGTVSRIMG